MRTRRAVAYEVARWPVATQAQVPRPCSHVQLRYFSLEYGILQNNIKFKVFCYIILLVLPFSTLSDVCGVDS